MHSTTSSLPTLEESLSNEDLAPVAPEQRTWTKWNFAALWVGMCVCIPTYMLAASLMESGMHWWQALLTVATGNVIVLIPMLLNGHPGAKYGIPFPVLMRSSFGTRGAHIPSLLRGFIACGWFGIMTWIGGSALYSVATIIFDSMGIASFQTHTTLPFLGITPLQLSCFLLFWAMHMILVAKGIESIKWLENGAAPFLILAGIALFFWAVSQAGGLGPVFAQSTVEQVRGHVEEFHFWSVFFPMLTAMVGFWSTVALNIVEFTRYARSQKEQIVGQIISLPTTMILFSFIGISVTAATVVLFGEPIWDPVALLSRFESKTAVLLALFALIVATLTTNIAANIVSPANAFSNLLPKKISFKMGGLIAGLIGIVIMPWRLVSDLEAYIFTWLIGLSALLGAIAGIMLSDYYLLRKRHLSLPDLYNPKGVYAYGKKGFNWRALFALLAGVLPNLPGFLHAASNGSIILLPQWHTLYTYAWFVGVLFAGSSYLLLSFLFPHHPQNTKGSL